MLNRLYVVSNSTKLVGSLLMVCPSAQMVTTAIAVHSDGTTVLSNGATYGILLAILFTHGIVCSAATNVLARINLFYVVMNGECQVLHRPSS